MKRKTKRDIGEANKRDDNDFKQISNSELKLRKKIHINWTTAWLFPFNFREQKTKNSFQSAFFFFLNINIMA
jgi:hypothetical protein